MAKALYLSHFGADLRPVYGEGKLTIGRSAGCDVKVPFPTVSRVHCTFAYDNVCCRFTVTDNNSLNGTLVNGYPMRPGIVVFIDHGDTVQVGSLVLECRIEEMNAAA